MFVLVFAACVIGQPVAAETVLIDDHFDRADADPNKESLGPGWSTNSRSRAKGNKQVWLKDQAMYAERHAVADHGVSVVHEAAFDDVRIDVRFKLGPRDALGLNLADMKESSVHAGHICMAKIRLNSAELTDLKTGRMEKDRRQRRLDGEPTQADQQRLRATSKKFPIKLSPNQWHAATLTVRGDTMTLEIDGDAVGEFRSEGIDHPTKSRLRLAVDRAAWIDDVRLVRLDP